MAIREVIFRGKRIDNGEWIYGDLIQNVDCVKIREQEKDVKHIAKSFEIDPETVGQFTGLTDKNRKKIFEGDIVKFDDGTIYSIELINGVYRVIDKQGFCSFSVHNYYSCLEVIGNIHDNSELLKGGVDNG